MSPFFSPQSVFNVKLTATEALDPASQQSVAKILAWNAVKPGHGLGGAPYINTTAYSSPIYTVPTGAPTVPVVISKTGSSALTLMAAHGVPIPSNAKPAGGTDRHMVIWQPTTDTMWEFIGMNVNATDGKWHASWGGKKIHLSTDPGHYRNVFSGSTLVEDKHWGSTACSLPMVGGIALLSELQSGVIPHAISMGLPDCKKSAWVYPAQRTDGNDTAVNAIPEGARFRLDPKLNLAALGLPPLVLMLAKAAQDYGIIINDKTVSITTFRCEDPGPLTRAGQPNPYVKLFGGLSSSALAAKFPWTHLQQLAPPVNKW